MARENMTRYAVLGLLTTTCRTGYDMKQMIDRSLNHFGKSVSDKCIRCYGR